MNYFWLKKKAFLGSFVKNYIFITVLCFYSSKYSTNLIEMAQSPTFEVEVDDIVLNGYETEVGDVSLNYIVEFSPEEIVYNKDYSGSVALTAGEYLEVYPKIVTYGDYLVNSFLKMTQVGSFSASSIDLNYKDKINIYSDIYLEDGRSINIRDLAIYYNYYRNISISEFSLVFMTSVLSEGIEYFVPTNNDLDIDLSNSRFFAFEGIYVGRSDVCLNYFSDTSVSEFSLGEMNVPDKYDLAASLELEDARLLPINDINFSYNPNREIEITAFEESDPEDVELNDISYSPVVNVEIGISELYNFPFSMDVVSYNSRYSLNSNAGALSSLHTDLEEIDYNDNIDTSVVLSMFYTNQLLNGLRVEYSKSIINYVNIGSNESSNISLSELTIKGGIELVQGISSIGSQNFSLKTTYANDNYSVSIGGFEFETYMKFYNLNGKRFSDLDGLVFSDLMFN